MGRKKGIMAADAAHEHVGRIGIPPVPNFGPSLDLARRVIDFSKQRILILPERDPKHCWYASQAMLHFMRDQLVAATVCAEQNPFMPAPIAVLCRPIYEAMLQMFYLLRPDDPQERENRGRLFWHFEALETVEGIRTGGGEAAYLAQASDEERRNYERRKEIIEQAKSGFSPKQQKQIEKGKWAGPWTGLEIKQLAREFEQERNHKLHVPWYGVMSMLTHVSPGIVHWSYPLLDPNGPPPEDQIADKADRDSSRSADWLRRGAGTMFIACLRFLQAFGYDDPAGVETLRRELSGSDEPRPRLAKAREIVDLVHRIVPVAHPARIILFGSAALGEPLRGDSDFDLLVILPDGANLRTAEDAIHKSLWGFPLPVDLVVVGESDVEKHGASRGNIIHTALDEGEVIYDGAQAE